MRIGHQPLLRRGDLDAAEQRHRFGPRRLGRQSAATAQHFLDLRAHAHHRVEGRHRLLEDHGQVAPAPLAPLRRRQRGQLLGIQRDAPARAFDRLGQQAHHRQRQHALAAARLADHAQHLAGTERERHVIEDAVAAAGQHGGEMIDGEDRAHLSPHPRVEHVAQPVAQQVEAQHRHDDRNTGKQRDPRRIRHEIPPLRDDAAEGRRRRRRPDADIGEGRFRQDRDREHIGQPHDQRAHGVGQHMAQQHAELTGPQGARRLDEFALAHHQHRGAHDARRVRRRRHRQARSRHW